MTSDQVAALLADRRRWAGLCPHTGLVLGLFIQDPTQTCTEAEETYLEALVALTAPEPEQGPAEARRRTQGAHN